MALRPSRERPAGPPLQPAPGARDGTVSRALHLELRSTKVGIFAHHAASSLRCALVEEDGRSERLPRRWPHAHAAWGATRSMACVGSALCQLRPTVLEPDRAIEHRSLGTTVGVDTEI